MDLEFDFCREMLIFRKRRFESLSVEITCYYTLLFKSVYFLWELCRSWRGEGNIGART